MKNSQAADERQKVRDAAFRLLAVRARSRKELDDRLTRKGHSRELIDATLDDFREKDYQSDDEFEAELEQTKLYFSQISTTQNFSVRPALTRRGQRRQQKGVDVLLAIECLMHAVRNNIDEATILTADLDFFPLFEALLQTKTKSCLSRQLAASC